MVRPTTPLPALVSLEVAAVRLGISTRTLARWIAAGRIATVRLPGRGVRIAEAVLAKLERGDVTAATN